METRSIAGGCYCGAVRYRASAAVKHQSNCYCANCRRAVGAQSVAWITIDSGTFELVRGEPARFRTDTSAWRTFCSMCGTSLTYENDARPGEIDITTGSLDDPQGFPPTLDVFADERLPWDPELQG